jgi:hypothetical protein
MSSCEYRDFSFNPDSKRACKTGPTRRNFQGEGPLKNVSEIVGMIFTSKWKPVRESRQRQRILVSIIDLTQSWNGLITIHSADDVLESAAIPSLSATFGSTAWLVRWIVEHIGSFTEAAQR